LNAHQKEKNGQQQQRIVMCLYLMPVFFVQSKKSEKNSRAAGKQSHASEKIHWLGGIAAEHFQCDQIEDYFEGAGKAILTSSVPPLMMPYRNFRNASASPRSIDRDESMHFSVKFYVLQDFSAVPL